jgi:ribosomal protein S9
MKEVQEKLSKHEINIIVHGSHPTTMRQPKAVAHAIARALMNYDPCLAPLLRQAGFGGVKVKVSDRRISDESNRNSKSD